MKPIWRRAICPRCGPTSPGCGARARARARRPWRITRMNDPARMALAVLVAGALAWPGAGHAQMRHHHAAPPDTTSHHHGGTDMGGMHMAGMDMGSMPMAGLYGPYAMSREASGTSWQPQ